MWLINACQRRNWAYITPSYRLLPEAKGLDILSDAIDASFWVRKNLTERIILAGSSAGALLAFATAAHPRSSPPLCLLSIYGMLDLTAERYIIPGCPLVGPPMDESRAIMQQMEGVAQNAETIDGYPFPEDPGTDTRFAWINAMHQEATIPDTLIRIPGLSKRIRELGAEIIPKEQRALFPALFAVSGRWPPTILIHGEADSMVAIDQSEGMADKLESVGVRVLFERVGGKDHGFDVGESPLDINLDVPNENDPAFYEALRRALKFLDSNTLQA